MSQPFQYDKKFFENFLGKIRRPQWGCCIFAASKERDKICALPREKNLLGLPVKIRQVARKETKPKTKSVTIKNHYKQTKTNPKRCAKTNLFINLKSFNP